MSRISQLSRTDWFGPLLATLLAILVVRGFSETFLSPYNIQILLLAIAVNALIAFSQMVIIAIGQMNLSVGAIGGLAAITFAGAMEVWGLPAPLAVMLALGVGAACGAMNGALIRITGISAFVITLATLSIFKGINLGLTEAQPFYGIPEGVKAFGNATILGIVPLIFVPTLLVSIALWYMLRRLPVGRFILAVGSNEHAAELSGISVTATVVIVHVLSGVIAAIAGILLVARLEIGQPSIGDDWLILSFAAPVIGGAVLAGGHVSVSATLLGVVIVAVITQALVLFSIDPFLVQVVLGAMILAAVGLNRLRAHQPVSGAG
ncbi:monosaccharide ABC transporter membrane protein (CUT2 family) [Palleronia aestuarii]|uniref:Monosaccharide ABC transporter membrane protein (CUT2 family) n=1 Tax=Palleronia aestuarii TaxID=568105 RepID=A0A2W7NAH3_9RHOB|nr:ABC transporter permease [Palleronia aestuarii]PZX17078.1 monosaccharide ABC transporter membrane protein (CUT2 family) [Palleronia aestuarii]